MNNNLKTCPFCGSDNIRSNTNITGPLGEQKYETRVTCLKCDARGPSGTVSNGGIKQWNMRANNE